DGKRPLCSPCHRSKRECLWPTTETPSTSPRLPQGHQTLDFKSTDDPEVALQNIEVFSLFRHYITTLASWYDLNDRHRHFTDLVPVKARRNPLLLSAILAFSAASKQPTDRHEVERAAFYHFESVRILLRITSNAQDVVSNGEVLAAICLLRSYEIISENLSSQSHLQGCYSLLASQPINLHSNLVRAAFWNYLREDITVALIERRELMIELSDDHLPRNLEADDDYANYITVLLGQIINQCFGNADHVDLLEWSALRKRIIDWRHSLPASFTPIPVNKEGNFEFAGTLCGWHAAALQYFQTAFIILELAKPKGQMTTTENMKQITNLTRELETRASEICALALSSDSQAVWINAFGPIAFCGCWLRDQNKITEILKGVQEWGALTGWPVSDIIQSLKANTSAAE
ncbi:hypothetical protein N7448_002206, partial [Penicillium atrosanguineum]